MERFIASGNHLPDSGLLAGERTLFPRACSVLLKGCRHFYQGSKQKILERNPFFSESCGGGSCDAM
jgi:hypothetical protein